MISVIVPIYNAEKFLHKSIDSILSQSYANLDVILVDDGSADTSSAICDFYKEKDKRVSVIHKPNGGLVSARKTGIKAAKGEFVCWVDADDWVEKDFVKDFVEHQKSTQADLVAMALYHDINEISTVTNNGLNDGVYSIGQLLPKLIHTGKFYEYGICPHLVTKMFRTEIVRESQLDVDERILAGEDAAVTYSAILKCNKVAIFNKANYHYVQHPSSITKVASENEIARIHVLIEYLTGVFKDTGVYDVLKDQLSVYRNYILALRKIDYFDSDNILNSYGGFERGSKIVIYGAGVMGQMIYKYISPNKKLDIVGWVDRNYKYYRQIGYAVDEPDSIADIEEYDYILVANISENSYEAIKEYLVNKGISDDKIRWFSETFRCGL